jgi:hypothetical protein
MTEPDVAVALGLSVVKFFMRYERGMSFNPIDQTTVPLSSVEVFMSVKGATVEHHHNKPITKVDLVFLEGELEANRVGSLDADPAEPEIMVHANLPLADFAGFWAALRLDPNARLECMIKRDDVIQLGLFNEVSLPPV